MTADTKETLDTAAAPKRRNWGATIGLGLFTGFSLLITVLLVIDFFQAVGTYFWQESTCTIESSEVVSKADEYSLSVRYRYFARGDTYTGDRVRHDGAGSSNLSKVERLAARYATGETVPCWTDPDAPHRSYLQRANLWRGFFILLPLLFVAIGGGSLYLVHVDGKPKKKELQGAVIGLILFGAFFLLGFGMFVPFFLWPALQVVEARSWEPVPCEIESSHVQSHQGDDSTTYSIEVLYRYRVDGQEHSSNRYKFMSGSSSGYEGKAAKVAEIPPGTVTQCYVNPEDPFDVVLYRGFSLDFLFGLIPLLFGVIGAAGLGFGLWSRRQSRRDAEKPSWVAPPQSVETEPGPVHLEPAQGPLGKLGCSILVALLWNGLLSVFLWVLYESWKNGATDWFLALFLIPFVLVGLLLLSAIPYAILALVNPRPRVRLSRSALKPGESAQIDWTFTRAASRVKALKIHLEQTRARGSSDSEEDGESRSIEILDWGEGYPLEFGSVSFRIPHDAQPSPDLPGLPGGWKLKFQGRIDYWPDAIEEFELKILPPE